MCETGVTPFNQCIPWVSMDLASFTIFICIIPNSKDMHHTGFLNENQITPLFNENMINNQQMHLLLFLFLNIHISKIINKNKKLFCCVSQ